jgi:hypothetical protein
LLGYEWGSWESNLSHKKEKLRAVQNVEASRKEVRLPSLERHGTFFQWFWTFWVLYFQADRLDFWEISVNPFDL